MFKGKPGRNSRELHPDMDCCTCWQRKTCEQAKEGTFCTRWASREPAPEGEDPNELWMRGEDET